MLHAKLAVGRSVLLLLVLGLPHVTLLELRLALISYQDDHMLLLTLAGLSRAITSKDKCSIFSNASNASSLSNAPTTQNATNATRTH